MSPPAPVPIAERAPRLYVARVDRLDGAAMAIDVTIRDGRSPRQVQVRRGHRPRHTRCSKALPALGVVDHFDQFPAAPDTALLGAGRRALLGVRARPVGVSKRQRGLEWAA